MRSLHPSGNSIAVRVTIKNSQYISKISEQHSVNSIFFNRSLARTCFVPVRHPAGRTLDLDGWSPHGSIYRVVLAIFHSVSFDLPSTTVHVVSTTGQFVAHICEFYLCYFVCFWKQCSGVKLWKIKNNFNCKKCFVSLRSNNESNYYLPPGHNASALPSLLELCDKPTNCLKKKKTYIRHILIKIKIVLGFPYFYAQRWKYYSEIFTDCLLTYIFC